MQELIKENKGEFIAGAFGLLAVVVAFLLPRLFSGPNKPEEVTNQNTTGGIQASDEASVSVNQGFSKEEGEPGRNTVGDIKASDKAKVSVNQGIK